MKLYHGSSTIVGKPEFGKGKPYNDYGLGFYCTQSMDMAREWAVEKDRDGYVNMYDFDVSNLKILRLDDTVYTTMHWLAILLKNREFIADAPLSAEAKEYILEHFLIPYEEYDVIIGYRADDSYFSFARDFISGAISYRHLSNAMKLGNLGLQVVLKSQKAFQNIKYLGVENVLSAEWYEKRRTRDQQAREEYFDSRNHKREKGDIFITHILDEEMKADDERLR